MRNILPLSQSTFCSWGVDMSWFCSVCEKSFSRKDNMQRHAMSKHRNAGLTPFQTVPMSSQKCQRCRFEHPFTSMIAGMTGSGKTACVRSLLQQASETMYPPPGRIVWCSQWQPAYTQMLVAMPHRIRQGNSYGFGARFLFWREQTEFDRVWWSDDWRQ